jgi:hypothetical protein
MKEGKKKNKKEGKKESKKYLPGNDPDDDGACKRTRESELPIFDSLSSIVCSSTGVPKKKKDY